MLEHNDRQAGNNEKRAYLARFFVVGLDICGSGGDASIVRSRSSVRLSPCARGSNSIDLSSAACCAADGFGLFISEV